MKQRYLSFIVWGMTSFHIIFSSVSISANPLTKSIKNGIGAIKQAAAETKVIRKILSAVSQQVTEAEKSGNPNTPKQGPDTHSTFVKQPTKHPIKVHSQYKPWPQQIIPYDLSKITEKELISKIQDAMKKWEERTGIHFIDKTKCRSAHDYLQFQLISQDDPRAGVAQIGYGKGVRKVLLNHTDEPTILHELGHSIGLDHEHNRSDRDSYIIVYYDNIDPKFHFSFQKNKEIPLLPYDYQSIMHYPSFKSFAYSSVLDSKLIQQMKPMLTKKDGSLVPDNSNMSDLDVQRVKLFYASFEKNQVQSTNNCPLSSSAKE